MRIAISQTNIKSEDKSFNYKKAKEMVDSAILQRADLILFPEMSFTGFSMNVEQTADTEEKINKVVQSLIGKASISVGFGWTKSGNILAENHYTIMDEKGRTILDYIKIHPFSFANENLYFTSGNKLSFCTIKDMVISTVICYDLRFPEIFQASSKRASLIIVPANWPERRIEHWRCLLRARAIENQCYIVGINCVGKQKEEVYSGNSCIINPNGDIIFEICKEESLYVCDIKNDVDTYQNGFPLKSDRRTDLYKQLI